MSPKSKQTPTNPPTPNNSTNDMSRRDFLRVGSMATLGGFAIASGANLLSPRIARAQGIKGSKMTIFW